MLSPPMTPYATGSANDHPQAQAARAGQPQGERREQERQAGSGQRAAQHGYEIRLPIQPMSREDGTDRIAERARHRHQCDRRRRAAKAFDEVATNRVRIDRCGRTDQRSSFEDVQATSFGEG